MKNILISITLITAVTLFTGCSGGSSDNTEAIFTEGKVIFADGTTLGVTRAEGQENGGFNIYDIGTGTIVGFITLDGSVNDTSGVSYGTCQGLTITENGLNGGCSLTINNPNSTTNEGSIEESDSSSSSDGSTSDTSSDVDESLPEFCDNDMDAYFVGYAPTNGDNTEEITDRLNQWTTGNTERGFTITSPYTCTADNNTCWISVSLTDECLSSSSADFGSPNPEY